MSKTRGDIAENLAIAFLRKRKLKIVETNYHCRWGEIDVIARENDILAFIEVRYRKSIRFGNAWETVNKSKQQRIIKTALHFIANHPEYNYFDLRFDLVSMTGELHKPEIDWFPAAFMA